MTKENFLRRMVTWNDTIKLLASIVGAMWFAILTFWSMTWSLWQAYDGRSWVREYLGIAEIARKIDGEDRIILTRTEASYAYTPVSRETAIITAVFAVRRTSAGAKCKAITATPMFEGERHIPRVGVLITPIQQVSQQWTPIEVQAEVPKKLAIGRALFWIVVDYDCPEGPRTDQTEPVAFEFEE